MVVRETRQIFNLSDIKAVRFQCRHCKREVVQSLASAEVGQRCPLCKEEWESTLPGDPRSANYFLIEYAKQLLNSPAAMTIRFEIDGEEA